MRLSESAETRRRSAHRGVFVAFNAEAVELSLDQLCAEAGVEILLHAFVERCHPLRRPGSYLTYRDYGSAHILEAAALASATSNCDLRIGG
jgi:hypothetical protein